MYQTPWLVPRSDEDLLGDVARGDVEALGELYDRYARGATGLARRVLVDAWLAEDAVHDAFLRIRRSAHRFAAERAPARTFIMTIVHRSAVDLARRSARRRTTPLDPELSDGSSTEESARPEARRVREALGELPRAQSEAILLAYFGGLTYSETAERLGVPVGTIKSRIFAGMTALRTRLGVESGDRAGPAERLARRDVLADPSEARPALEVKR